MLTSASTLTTDSIWVRRYSGGSMLQPAAKKAATTRADMTCSIFIISPLC